MTLREYKTWWLGWPAVSLYLMAINPFAGVLVLLIGALVTLV